MAGLIVFGGISYTRMGVSQLPDVDFPVVTVSVTWPGASPDVMESAVADVIEDAVMSVEGIEQVQSSSQEGQTRVTLQFGLNQDINVALQQVQTKVSQAQRNLPSTIDAPVIMKFNPNDQPIIWVAVHQAGGNVRDMGLFLRDHLKDAITTIPGVGDVFLGGYVAPQMRIWLDPDKMREKQITAQDIINAINNEHQLSATGYQETAKKETFVRVQSEFQNADECNNLVIPNRGGMINWKPIRIKDVATCVESVDDARRVSRYNTIAPTMALGIIKQPGSNAVSIGEAIKVKLEQLKKQVPKGMELGIVSDATEFIKDSVQELSTTLMLAILLTALVCYLFLGTFNSSLNVILAIPVSLIGAFIVLKYLKFTINTFTLMGLSLSIGIVVDDAIMVLENISRHLEMGKSRVHAALVGSKEIMGAAIAASLSILAIFVPVVFMQGIVGKFFFQFGVTLSVAIIISLLEALTLAPMRCSQFLKVGQGNFITKPVSRGMDGLTKIYASVLEKCLNWRWMVLGLATAIFAFSLMSFSALKKEFLPSQDLSRFLVNLYTPIGSSIQFTDDVFKKMEAFFKTRPEIDNFYVSVGGFEGGIVNQGISFVTLKDKDKRPVKAPFTKSPTQQEFMDFVRQELNKIQGLERVSMMDLSLAGFTAQRGYPIEFQLQGPNWDKLIEVATKMRHKLSESGYMSDVDTDYRPDMPELQIIPNREKASQMGVPVATISNAVASMVGGKTLSPSKYTDSQNHRSDIKMKLREDKNRSPQDIKDIFVRNIQGEIVPLSSVVEFKDANSLLTITRYNRERGISIFGNVATGKSQADVAAYIEDLAKKDLPEGYRLNFAGSSQAFKESFQSLLFALLLGIVVAYMILASQFNSFLHPIIILLALPFSLTGALWAMRLTDVSLNIYSLIGILLLMGIVKKNSILLVEFTNHVRRDGANVRDALLKACPIRLRPIIMTSIATIAGALPAALSVGAGAELMRPMAVSVIGGVIVSTFLTLFVVPCAYSLMARFENKSHALELEKALQELKA